MQNREITLLSPQDAHRKRLEKQIAIRNYRVSITNPNDAIARKGYNFQVSRSAAATDDRRISLVVALRSAFERHQAGALVRR